MAEAAEGVATIEDIDEDTFARFCDYVYQRSYQEAPPSSTGQILFGPFEPRDFEESGEDSDEEYIDEASTDEASTDEEDSDEEESDEKEAEDDSWVIKQRGFIVPPNREEAWQRFLSLKYNVDEKAVELGPDISPLENYTETFLSHAKLYVFADRYDVEHLRQLCLHELHKTLRRLTIYPTRAADVASLLEYVYAHTPDRVGEIDQLRSLVVQYICCCVEFVFQDETFQEVIKGENSAFVDLMKHLTQRLEYN